MKLANRLSLLALKSQKYISMALMAYAVLAIILMTPPESGGGTGM
jgi:hypothetical protein